MPVVRSIFRNKAIESRRQRGLRSELVVLDSAATNWGFRLIMAGMVTCVAFIVWGRLNEYASGPAFVQVDGRVAIVAESAGLVTEVLAKPGAPVAQGDVLVRFDSSKERAELRAIDRQFKSQLAKLLLQPNDAAAREALVQLRAQQALAQQRLDRRSIRATQKGIVGDVRVRSGQMVEPGLHIIDLQENAGSATVTALLPGKYRPLLQAGAPIRFELDGFNRFTQELTIKRVGEQIVGPREAARYIGRDLADAFSIAGPVVMVEASLPKTTFISSDQRFEYASGMLGKAEAVVRNEPIAYAILPNLKHWGQEAKSYLGDTPEADTTVVQE